MVRLIAFVALLMPTAAFAHPGHDEAASLAAGLSHPLTGFDHVAAMVAVGLWAALKGGRALWAWPAAFVGVMLIGGVLGMMQVPLPFVEPGILASVVVLGAMVALAIDVPVGYGALVVGTFALLHGYAHGLEAPGATGGFSYMIGFALATAVLHGAGIAAALALKPARRRPLVRLAGAACVVIGVALITQAI